MLTFKIFHYSISLYHSNCSSLVNIIYTQTFKIPGSSPTLTFFKISSIVQSEHGSVFLGNNRSWVFSLLNSGQQTSISEPAIWKYLFKAVDSKRTVCWSSRNYLQDIWLHAQPLHVNFPENKTPESIKMYWLVCRKDLQAVCFLVK